MRDPVNDPAFWVRGALLAAASACLVLPLAAQEKAGPDISFAGTILFNGWYTAGKTNNADIPQFVVRATAADSLGSDATSATLRQTRLRAHLFWADVAGGELRAEVDADFYGGQPQSPSGKLFSVLRLRRAIAELRWDRGSVLVGQEVPLIAEINPSSFASIGLSGFSGSGNLWFWLPQIRGRLELAPNKPVGVGIEAAVLAPTNNDVPQSFLTVPDRAELSGRPYLQSRISVRWGKGDLAGEASLGGHLGWLATGGDSLLTSKAATIALRVPLGRVLEVRGEAFAGQALAGLGGGGIGQNQGLAGVPIRTRGGWGQLLVHPDRDWELGGGVGIDDPDDDDVDPATQRLRNRSYEAHVHWKPTPLILGLEYRRVETLYATGTEDADHVNLALGVSF